MLHQSTFIPLQWIKKIYETDAVQKYLSTGFTTKGFAEQSQDFPKAF